MALSIILPDIGEVRADTPAELAALVKQLRQDSANSPKAVPTPLPVSAAQPAGRPPVGQIREFPPQVTRRDKAILSLRFLRVIAKAGMKGVPSAEMQEVLGVNPLKPKGISGKTGPINAYLHEIGLHIGDTYSTVRTPLGRVWYPAKQIFEAITLIDRDVEETTEPAPAGEVQ